MDDTSLRLMAVQGNQIKEWAESPLEPGLIENNVIAGETELATKIKQLLEVEKIKTSRVYLGFSGMRCLTRPITFPRLPKEMIDEAVRREAQRVLPVPLEELYLSWQTYPYRDDQTQVFMAGIPRTTVDSLYKVMEKAGLKASYLQIKPLLLAGVVREKTSVIIDVQVNEFDIVVMYDGVPQPVRSMRFARGALSNQEKLETISSELTRTLTFYNTNNTERVIGPNVPIFVSGLLAREADLYQELSSEIGHPVQQLVSPLECPPGLDTSHYMANIGLAIQTLPFKERTLATPISLNTLPPAYQTRAVSLSNVLTVPGAVLSVGVLAFGVVFVQTINSDIASLTAKLESTNQLLQQRQTQKQEMASKIKSLQVTVSGTENSRNNLSKVLEVLDTQARETKNDLLAAIDSFPSTARLFNINYVGDILTISGQSSTENQVLSCIKKLDETGRFEGHVIISEMVRNDDGDIDFTLVGTLQSKGVGVTAIEIALGGLPGGVNVTDIDSSDNSLIVRGVSATTEKIFAYLKTLDASTSFKEVTVSDILVSEDGYSFSLLLKTGG
jgi:type IV pilus assembly protein PilM